MNKNEAVAAKAAMARLVSMITPVNLCALNAPSDEIVPKALSPDMRALLIIDIVPAVARIAAAAAPRQ
ncbi:hypothetical protein A6U87_26685 [Rhizobium sp. AC44/96]|nr:hypothetical protein A6U87_26685 [Rhizobium sp. AC44/96]